MKHTDDNPQSIIRILAIVPSESIQVATTEIAQKYNNKVYIEAHVANLYAAQQLAEQRGRMFDIILARGESAKMIGKALPDVPVVEIPITITDVLLAIKLAENYQERFVVVGFTYVTSQAHILRNILQMDLDIYTIYQMESAQSLLQELWQKGYRFVVSGMGIDHIARRVGLNTIQVTTGKNSIQLAVDQAVTMAKCIHQQQRVSRFFQQALEQSPLDLLVFDQAHSLVYSRLSQLDQKTAIQLATRELQSSDTNSMIQKTRDAKLITMYRNSIEEEGGPSYTAFYFLVKPQPFIPAKNEIRIFSKDQAAEVFLQHFPHESPTYSLAHKTVERMQRSMTPVMILGEIGTGKEQVASMLYIHGRLQTNPFYLIDFTTLTERTWNYLLSHTSSPLFEVEKTVYFKNLNALPPSQVLRLKDLLVDSGYVQHNRVIFSCTTNDGYLLSEQIRALIDELGCQTIALTPLRKRAEELNSLYALYISAANVHYAKQILGFSQEAERILGNYSWPGNLTQFRRVVFRLVELTSSSYIHEALVEQVLDEETENLSLPLPLDYLIDSEKTLHEIQTYIAKAMLKKSDGNRTKTAEILGISRTTLWRMLQ